ncbi:hypothetical protein MQX03_17060 [Chryseobacterium aahli]|uniref:hypothetical protein n=1 Tax=Chryseobacterium aahli TaxID=1278643 RepID=UPI001F5FFE29|nr:hypothetical protein [Chryseobacterium aahli]MCI3938912.1 hypothetical protein [Chryseobacterium aahli]
MRKLCIILLLNSFYLVFAQSANPEISNELPKIVPPSPSVSSLMKFEEIPVSGYTGTPDISIPLYKLSTHSKDIELDISLKYHPGNVKADNVAGDVGLGWSVFAGGTVSRTVRGLPDEELVMAGTNQSGKVGMYHTTVNNHNNIYYQWIQNPVNFEQNNPNIANEYYWETVENGKYDTEHDLWQFNFMGNTGSFYLKRIDNQLIVEPLNDYRLHIQTNFETYYNQPYTPTGFTIFDEKGYKYIFDVYETTAKSSDGLHLTIQNNNYVSSNTHSDDKAFRSSFHLTKVIDSNNKTVFDISYDDTVFKENNLQYNKTRNEYDDAGMNAMKYANCWNEIPPMESTVSNNNIVTTKKIKTITIADKAIIDFTYLTGRDDYSTNASTPFLKEIKLKNINQSLVSKFTLDYDYNQIIVKRMFLKSIVKSYPNQSGTEKHEFYYKRSSSSGNPSVFGRDFWGYFNTFNSDNCNAQDITYMREASPHVSTYDVLQRIKYPTRGSAVFLFETNQYSFTGNEPINDFAENPDNSTFIETVPYYFTNSSSTHSIPISTEKRKIIVYPSIVLDNNSNWTRTFHISKIVNGQNIPIGSIHCILPEANCCKEFILEPNTQYVLTRLNFELNYTDTDNMTVNYHSFNQNNKFLYGGGNRIKKIGYFNGEIPQDYYEVPNQNINPNKEKIYHYNLHSDRFKSSGSLVFGKPKFEEYRFVKQLGTKCELPPYSSYQINSQDYQYLSKFVISNQEQVFTQGSSVGYKNVRIIETGLGSTEQVFSSPIDYPETELITYTKPYLPSKNIDYKRGLLLEERIKNESGRLLNETLNTYSFENYEKTYGYRFNRPDGMLFQGRLKPNHSFQGYLAAQQMAQTEILECGNSFSCDSFSKSHLLGTSPVNDIDFYPLISAYGWAKLTNKTTRNYFYEGATQKMMEQNETFEYNNTNKKIAQHGVTTSDGSNIKKKFYYDIGNNSGYSQNRISEIKKIETFKNDILLNTKEIDYSNTWSDNVSYLPKLIKESQANNPLKTELIYDQYDDKGNVLQYTTKDGKPTSIIWGYHKTQPIAKIEGALYDNIKNNSLITAIINASNSDAANPATESSLIAALDALRNDVNFKSFQMATITYDPLIGVTTLTPPSGIREIYKYDSAGRLEKVIDEEGKILKENTYNYKP